MYKFDITLHTGAWIEFEMLYKRYLTIDSLVCLFFVSLVHYSHVTSPQLSLEAAMLRRRFHRRNSWAGFFYPSTGGVSGATSTNRKWSPSTCEICWLEFFSFTARMRRACSKCILGVELTRCSREKEKCERGTKSSDISITLSSAFTAAVLDKTALMVCLFFIYMYFIYMAISKGFCVRVWVVISILT